MTAVKQTEKLGLADLFCGSFPKIHNLDDTVIYPLSKVKRISREYRYDILITMDLEWYYFGSTNNMATMDELFIYLEFIEEGYKVIDTSINKKILEYNSF